MKKKRSRALNTIPFGGSNELKVTTPQNAVYTKDAVASDSLKLLAWSSGDIKLDSLAFGGGFASVGIIDSLITPLGSTYLKYSINTSAAGNFTHPISVYSSANNNHISVLVNYTVQAGTGIAADLDTLDFGTVNSSTQLSVRFTNQSNQTISMSGYYGFTAPLKVQVSLLQSLVCFGRLVYKFQSII